MLSSLFSRQMLSMIFLILVLLISLGVSAIYNVNGIHENMENQTSILPPMKEEEEEEVKEEDEVKPDETLETEEKTEGFEPLRAKITAKEL